MPLLNMSFFSNGNYELVKESGELLQKLVQIFLSCPEDRVILKSPRNVIQNNAVKCNSCKNMVSAGFYFFPDNSGKIK